MRRRPTSPPVDPAPAQNGRGDNGGRSFAPVDWSAFLRRIERKRRLLSREGVGGGGNGNFPLPPPPDYYARATYASFLLDGLDVTEAEAHDALAPAPGPERPMLRSRLTQRLRNHAAILHHVENDLRLGLPLTTDGVVRWYVAVSAGLSTTSLDGPSLARLEDVVRRINSPQLRLQAALQEIATTHVKLFADPLVPSFNGILARLLLRYHLGRCKLPAVVFHPVLDARIGGADAVVGRLVELLEQSFDELLARKA